MSGVSSPQGAMRAPGFEFTEPGTLLFVTGVPLSGKSTISPQLTASIQGCSMQNLDIFRLLAQTVDEMRPPEDREAALQFGSCDGYLAVGDGSYTPDSLIEGFGRYSRAVFALADIVIPSLEAQGAQSVLFEGAQLMPSLVAPHLKGNSKLIVVTSDEVQLKKNRNKLFGGDPVMEDRYSDERLLLLQDEILRQADALPENSVLRVNNVGQWQEALPAILDFLQSTGAIRSLVSTAE